jgi:hypothetical protein
LKRVAITGRRWIPVSGFTEQLITLILENKMKLCSHVVTDDTGLAPNPFHGYCTSAVCTPSHKNAQLERGDWLIGNSVKADRYRLVYAMQISEVLTMEDYFADPRFQAKKPNPDGTLEEQCGDNIYYKEKGRWRRLPSRFHNDCEIFKKDLRKKKDSDVVPGGPVFIARRFYYFGANRVDIPPRLSRVIKDRQGLSNTISPLADDFVTWLEANYTPGIHGRPRDQKDNSRQAGPMLTDYLADCMAVSAEQAASRPAPARSRGGCR